MWITQLFKNMRTWLHSFYQDLHSVPASHYSLDPSNYSDGVKCLDDSLVFTRRPKGTAIPVGSKLLQVRHASIDRRIWIRLRDPGSSKRKLSPQSPKVLKMFEQWLRYLSPSFLFGRNRIGMAHALLMHSPHKIKQVLEEPFIFLLAYANGSVYLYVVMTFFVKIFQCTTTCRRIYPA